MPIHAGGGESGAIIGALAVSTPLRSQSTSVFKFLGSGLGLAIVRALVEAHDGEIEAGERAGGGASFSFTLPTTPSTDSDI